MQTREEIRLESLKKELKKANDQNSYCILAAILVVLLGFASYRYGNIYLALTMACCLVLIAILHQRNVTSPKIIEKRIAELESSPTIVTKKATSGQLSEVERQLSRTTPGPQFEKLETRASELQGMELRLMASELQGYDKYLCNIYEALERHNGLDKVEEYLSNQYKLASNARANTHDPYIWGGIANGLVGPAAGVATALQTAQENAVAENRAANIRANAMGNYVSGIEGVSVLRGDLPSRSALERTMREVTSHRIDMMNPDGYLHLLWFESVDESATITEGGSLQIDILVSCSESPVLSGMPAAIDGTIRVIALVDQEVFAEGYLIGHAVGETDISKVGLSEGTRARKNPVLLVPVSAGKSFTSSTKYELEYESIHLWAIQQ